MALLAAYNFDEESGDVLDVAGHGNGFTLQGSSVRTSGGHTDKGLTQTSGTDDPGPTPGFALTSNRTMMMWIRSTASTADGRIFEHIDDSGESVWEFLFRGSVWHLQAWNADDFGRATTARPTDSQWHHLAGTYDGTNLRLYLDATLVATTALSAPLRSSASTLYILRNLGSAEHAIDDFRVFDEALDQPTIETLMNTPVSAGAMVVSEVQGSLEVESSFFGFLETPTPSVPALSGSLTVSTTLSGVLTPVEVIEAVTGDLRASISMGGVLETPDASVPSLEGGIGILVMVAMGGTVIDRSGRDVSVEGNLQVDDWRGSISVNQWAGGLVKV